MNKNITVRIREINNSYLLQIKVPVNEKGSLHIKKEYEMIVNEVPKEISSDDIFNLCGIRVNSIKLIGSLQTIRKINFLDENTEICLDKNKYLNTLDYEIEIEYKENLDIKLLEQIKNLNIDICLSVQGKYSRFLCADKRKR